MYLKRLRELREDHDYTQEFIGKKTNMKREQYYRYESGKRDIPLDTLIILAELYGTSVDYILGLTDEKEPYKKNS
ncbi:MAG: helix-turn-helix transcriptional regulator [Clostridia bacterium]|nr:helix-turn-helix transcriptional regulator [Clostridia bacterium]